MDYKKGGLIAAFLLIIILLTRKVSTAMTTNNKTIDPTNISEHITYKEGVVTQTGLKNVPNENHIKAMKLLATKVFEPARKHFKEPIIVNSFFRPPEVNRSVGGSATSQHMAGEAMDIKAPFTAKYTNADLFNWLKNNVNFDQLIWEFGNNSQPQWIHVSYKNTGNRKRVLRAISQNGSTLYINYQ